MPKIKTKKIVRKRFRLTKRGKILHRTQGLRHLRRTKNKARQRRQNKVRFVTNAKYKRVVKQLLGK